MIFRYGGVDVLESFFDEVLWHRMAPTQELKTLKERIKKYVARLNYGHFSQFDVPLEFITRNMFQSIQSQEKALA